MERRKIPKKNEPKPDPKCPVTVFFFNKPLLFKAFQDIANEKGFPVRKIIISFAALGLKAYLKETGQAFKEKEIEDEERDRILRARDDALSAKKYLTPEEIKERGWDKYMNEEFE